MYLLKSCLLTKLLPQDFFIKLLMSHLSNAKFELENSWLEYRF